jgi:hypothetical protein
MCKNIEVVVELFSREKTSDHLLCNSRSNLSASVKYNIKLTTVCGPTVVRRSPVNKHCCKCWAGGTGPLGLKAIRTVAVPQQGIEPINLSKCIFYSVCIYMYVCMYVRSGQHSDHISYACVFVFPLQHQHSAVISVLMVIKYCYV